MPVERRTEGVGLALWWTRQRDRNYLRKRGGGRPLGPGMEGPRVEPGKPEGRRSSLSGGGNRKERPCTRLERASGDSNRRILKTVRPVVWEGAGAQSPAPDPIQAEKEPPDALVFHERSLDYRRVTQIAEDQAIISSSWITLT